MLNTIISVVDSKGIGVGWIDIFSLQIVCRNWQKSSAFISIFKHCFMLLFLRHGK